jgi:DNA invertase Pin-like site-specific DNA recombinase
MCNLHVYSKYALRSALDALQTVEDLKSKGVSLHLLDLGGDISDGLSKLFLTIAAAFAEAERDRIRERIAQAKSDQKARGQFLGGSRPFGFQRGEGMTLIPDESEQEAIREIVRLRAEGMALRPIAEAIRAKGTMVGTLRLPMGVAPRNAQARASRLHG